MKFLVLISLFLMTGMAHGQQLHMIEMSTSSTALGAFTFTDTPRTGTSLYFGGNYAYKISERVQLGIQGNYSRFHVNNTTEAYNFLAGAIYNFSDDLTDAFYTSLYGGMGWARYMGDGNSSTESLTGRFALGKRFALKNINLPNVTYSPEISYTRAENTKSSYGSNSWSIRFLQFSVFF